jgi:hypothetical protein
MSTSESTSWRMAAPPPHILCHWERRAARRMSRAAALAPRLHVSNVWDTLRHGIRLRSHNSGAVGSAATSPSAAVRRRCSHAACCMLCPVCCMLCLVRCVLHGLCCMLRSYVALSRSAAPLLAPILGSLLQSWSGWQSTAAMPALALCCIVASSSRRMLVACMLHRLLWPSEHPTPGTPAALGHAASAPRPSSHEPCDCRLLLRLSAHTRSLASLRDASDASARGSLGACAGTFVFLALYGGVMLASSAAALEESLAPALRQVRGMQRAAEHTPCSSMYASLYCMRHGLRCDM